MTFHKNEAGGFVGLLDEKRCVMQVSIDQPNGGTVVIHNEYPDTEDGRAQYEIMKSVLTQLQGASEEEKAAIKAALINLTDCAEARIA